MDSPVGQLINWQFKNNQYNHFPEILNFGKVTSHKNNIIGMEKIVIIGGVAAGATAAAKVRRISPDAEITMLESGPDISFANCGLPYI